MQGGKTTVSLAQEAYEHPLAIFLAKMGVKQKITKST
jgi:hypothetical protein